MAALKMTLQGDRQVIVTRRFAAAPARVWAAHTDAALMQRWLTGPDGWVMSECQCDARPGGTMWRCRWACGAEHAVAAGTLTGGRSNGCRRCAAFRRHRDNPALAAHLPKLV